MTDDRPNREVRVGEDGLLWLINRCLFHRHGYTLGIDSVTGRTALQGDGSQQWYFEPHPMIDQREKAARALLGDATVDRMLEAAGPENEDPIPA